MNVIGKMRLVSVEDFGWSRKFKFSAQHDQALNKDDPESLAFSKATPQGEAWMTVDNKHVWPAFQLPADGQSESLHYVVFIDAKEHKLEDVYRALAALNAG